MERAILGKAQAKPAVGQAADRSAEKRVCRGKVDIARRLDLHGLTQDQARAVTLSCVRSLAGEGGGVALVVTGKGGRLAAGEAAPGILKRRLPEWLSAPDFRPMIAGYALAHSRHGGAGAYYVFVRRSG
jgi:DNA-nicking Smr family endonuclease